MSDAYEKSFVRLLRLGRICQPLPLGFALTLGAHLGRRHSFLHHRRDSILANLRGALGLDETAANAAFSNLCASSGVATQMVWHLPNIDNDWLAQKIHTANSDSIRCLQAEGGVVLSHHSFHHNLLASSFKRWGLTTMPVANPPTAFSSNDYLYRFTLFLNGATETNLNGGRFLYVNGGREFLQSLRNALLERHVLLVFCDFNEAKPFNSSYPFLHRTLQPPSGVLRQALREGRPFYFAGFQWSPGEGFALSLRPLIEIDVSPSEDSLDTVLRRYLTALSDHLRIYPHAWQMWDSFS